MRKNKKTPQKSIDKYSKGIANHEIEFFKRFSRIDNDINDINEKFIETSAQLMKFDVNLSNLQCDSVDCFDSSKIGEFASKSAVKKSLHQLFLRVFCHEDM